MTTIGWIVFIIAFIIELLYGIYAKWSETKTIIVGALTGIACVVIFFDFDEGNGGNGKGFSYETVELEVKYSLNGYSNYENIHILDIKKVNEQNDFVTYEWKAEFKHLGVLCRQSGYIYLYNNGDIKDVVMLNDFHVVK